MIFDALFRSFQCFSFLIPSIGKIRVRLQRCRFVGIFPSPEKKSTSKARVDATHSIITSRQRVEAIFSNWKGFWRRSILFRWWLWIFNSKKQSIEYTYVHMYIYTYLYIYTFTQADNFSQLTAIQLLGGPLPFAGYHDRWNLHHAFGHWRYPGANGAV